MLPERVHQSRVLSVLRRRLAVVRAGVAVATLALVCVAASPRRVFETLISVEGEWLLAAALLAPVFLCVRMGKWYLLVRQSVRRIPRLAFVRGYLLGMTLGLVTPARSGELVRVWSVRAECPGQRTALAGYFVAEKLVEIVCLLALAALAMAAHRAGIGYGAGTLSVALVLLILLALDFARRRLGPLFDRAPILERLPVEVRNIAGALSRLKLKGCAALSLLCFLVYLAQVSLLMRAMGQVITLPVLVLLPVVMVSNLVPITPGGLGMREGLAVLVLKTEGVSEAVAFGSFFLTTVLDLVIPALAGSLLLLPGGPSGMPSVETERRPAP